MAVRRGQPFAGRFFGQECVASGRSR